MERADTVGCNAGAGGDGGGGGGDGDDWSGVAQVGEGDGSPDCGGGSVDGVSGVPSFISLASPTLSSSIGDGGEEVDFCFLPAGMGGGVSTRFVPAEMVGAPVPDRSEEGEDGSDTTPRAEEAAVGVTEVDAVIVGDDEATLEDEESERAKIAEMR